MPDITSIRQQYPQYSDMSDDDLASALHSKFYADIPEDQFRQKIGLGAPPAKPEDNSYLGKVGRAGEAVDKAAGPGLKGAARAAVGAVEDVGAMASGVVGDVAGFATSAATQNAEKGKAVKEALTYEPKTATGKAGAEYLGAISEPVSKLLNKVPNKLEQSGHPILAQGVRVAEDLIGGKKALEAPGAARSLAGKVGEISRESAAKSAAKTATSAAENAEKDALIKDVRKLGLRLTSQDVGAPIGKRVEAVASRPQLEREISLKNAPLVKKAAADDVGITEPLSAGSVNKAIKETLTPYTAPRKLGRVDLANDPKWKEALAKAQGISKQEEIDFPEDVSESIEKEVKKFDKPSADADSMVSKIAKLRERASDNFRGNADDKALARAQRSLATAMEEAIERHGEATGQAGVIKAFRDARVRLAKLYTIRDALTETGELDLGVLEKELNKGEKLSGNLLTLARAKSAFDRSFQAPENIRGHPVGAGDIALGVLAGGGKGAAAGGLSGMSAGVLAAASRPVTRAVMASKPYQKAFIKPRHKVSELPAQPKKRVEPTLGDMRE